MTPISFFRLILINSQYSEEDIQNLHLPVIREIVYRAISLCLPIFTLPFVGLTWLRHQYLLCLILLTLSVVVALSFTLLIKTNRRLISPSTLLFICTLQLLATVLMVQEYSILWSYAFTAGFYMLLARKQAVVVSVLWVLVSSALAFYLFSPEQALIYSLSLAASSLGMEVLSSILYRHEDNLKNLALRDPLTNAFNRRALMQELEEAEAVHKRYHTAMSIIMIDIDHFKKINDTYGHHEGDTVLVNFVEALSRRLRDTDKFFRLGGEEFVVLLQSTLIQEAEQIAASYCSLISKAILSQKVAITVSCGVAEVRYDESVSEWLNRCDSALYHAKSKGRNRVEMAPELCNE